MTWWRRSHAEVARRGADGAYLNGWDPLLQKGLPEPTLKWLNGVADTPLVIVHNSGHKAFFNSAAARSRRHQPRHPDPEGCVVRAR